MKISPLGVIDIAEKLKINKKQLELSLHNLQEKAVIKATSTLFIEFNAVSFEEAVGLLIEISKEQTEVLNEIRKDVQRRKLQIISKGLKISRFDCY